MDHVQIFSKVWGEVGVEADSFEMFLISWESIGFRKKIVNEVTINEKNIYGDPPPRATVSLVETHTEMTHSEKCFWFCTDCSI